jgi:serine/threonine protein kinase
MYVLSLNNGVSYLQFQLCCLKHVHSRNYIHRDLKPSNIVMGIGMESAMVYLIDFGLSKEYRNPHTYKHIPCKTNLGLTGTATFTSINSHLGLELGWRDDLEVLTYILIYFLHGDLPWQELPCGSKGIIKCKQQTLPSKLCRGLPVEFATFLKYSWSLSFEDIPDYGYISDLFNNLSSWEGFQNVVVFDWDRADKEQCQKLAILASDNADDTIGRWRKREGYVLFPWTSYVYLKLCLGCAPRLVNASILISYSCHNFLSSQWTRPCCPSYLLSILSIRE